MPAEPRLSHGGNTWYADVVTMIQKPFRQIALNGPNCLLGSRWGNITVQTVERCWWQGWYILNCAVCVWTEHIPDSTRESEGDGGADTAKHTLLSDV